MQRRWDVRDAITSEADANLAKFPPVLRQLLFNRGYGTEEAAEAFLRAEPEFDTNPRNLTGMEATVDRLRRAIERGEAIAIYGDYDVDGVTATALMLEQLRGLNARVRAYIPNRFDEGYGLNADALDSLRSDGVSVVMTVDCGIRSPKEAEHAREIGLDLIISDHHHPAAGDLPPAYAIVNPKQPGDQYADKDLAGVGVAYKVVQALATGSATAGDEHRLLDLVALGTVADLAPLSGENRSLVRTGLQEMRQTRRQGLHSLTRVAGMQLSRIAASDIGFILGPRLNAAGRLESAEGALELLITQDPLRAGMLAQELDAKNRERQVLTRETQIQAEQLATAEESDPALLFAVHEGFNPGIVGLAASRLVETHYRPAVVAARGPEETRGSCRSIPEFHITDALDACADLLVRHGGHAAAAGFTVRNKNLPELIRRLKKLAADQFAGLDLRPTIPADMEIPLRELSFDLLRELDSLEPTGYGNPEVVFVSRDAKVRSSRVVGAEGRHLKLALQDERGATLDGIGFRLGQLQSTLPARVDVAYTLELNEYNGRTTLQLNLRDVRATGGGP
jgi:single-stranded-DNA-specific exonuclease